jgi:hypothetical protein
VTIAPTSCSALIVIDVRRANSKFFQIKGVSFSDRLKIQAGLGTCTNDVIKFATSSSLGTPTFGRLQYLEVTGALNHGIQFTTSATNNEIKDNWIHHNGNNAANVDDTHGMYIHSADNLVEGNLVESNCNRGLQIFNSGSNNAHRNIVRRNIFKTNGTCEASANVVLSSGNDIQFYGNFVYGGNANGVSITSNSPLRTLIYNNTIYDNDSAGVSVFAGASGTRIINNIIRSNGSTVSDSGTSTVQTTNLTTDPSFINAGTGNLCLETGSSAINAGTATIATSPAVTRLFNGAAPDIGACETLPVTVATGLSAAADDAQHVDVTFPMKLATPLLPATGVTGFTLSDSRTITSAVKLSDSVVRLTYTGTCTAGTFSYSAGNLTDSALIGGSAVQPVFTITTQAITNNCGAVSTAELAQVTYRFYRLLVDEDGDLIGTGALNAPIRAALGMVFAVEIQTDCTEEDCAPLGQILQFDLNGSGSWTTITDECTGTKICFYGSGNTDPMLPSGVPDCPLSGAFTCVDGGTQRIAAAVPVIDLAQDNSVVNRYLLKAQAAVDEVLRLRLINQNGAVLSSYDQYPTITGRNAAGFR